MTHDGSTAALIGILAKLLPPKTCLHIGAGGHSSLDFDSVGTIQAQETVLVEADRRRYERLTERFASDTSVHFIQAAIGSQSGERSFYSLSMEEESGFLDDSTLHAIWPNLETVETDIVSTITADELFDRPELAKLDQSSCNWLVVGCLLAGEVLKAASKIMAHVDVAIFRAVRPEINAEPGNFKAASYADVASQAKAAGLLEVNHEIERNGKIGTYVFVRDLAEQISKPANRIQGLDETVAGLNGRLEAMFDELESAKNLAASAVAEQKAILSRASRVEEDLKTEVKDLRLILETKDTKVAAAQAKRQVLEQKNSELADVLRSLQSEYDKVVEEIAGAQKKQRIAEHNLSETRDNHEKIAAKLLERENQLVDLGNEVRRILRISGHIQNAEAERRLESDVPPSNPVGKAANGE